jgi:hypothetical protein
MRDGKHNLHFFIDNKLIPHSIINIPFNEKIHMVVY